MDPYLGFYVAAFAMLAALVFLLGKWIRKTFFPSAPKKIEDTSNSIAPSATSSVVEQYERLRKGRKQLGLCLYCNELATHQIPIFRIVRSWGDAILRYMGVHQKDRWRIVTSHGDLIHDVCENHYERCRGLLQERLVRHMADDARFTDGERKDLYEFQVASIFETVSSDMDALRLRRKQKVDLALVQPIKSIANGTS
jgi:hypothetical protein